MAEEKDNSIKERNQTPPQRDPNQSVQREESRSEMKPTPLVKSGATKDKSKKD